MLFTLCIPTMDRFDGFLNKYLPLYLNNAMVGEIIIGDENGNDVEKIKQAFPDQPKLKLFTNETRLGPFLNKLAVCAKATNEWIALIDSDNFAGEDYFQVAGAYLEHLQPRGKNIILAPAKALPRFDFSHMAGLIYKKGNFAAHRLFESRVLTPYLARNDILINTGNYVLNKYLINNLNLAAEQQNIPRSSACDVVYLNTLLFEQLDLNMHIVPHLEYTHVVHEGSLYMQTKDDFSQFNEEVYQRYRMLL